MEKPTQNFRIDKLSIRDYKGIDALDLEFPRPKFPGDPDIFVIGSRNGLGKTSVLECCAWGLTSIFVNPDNFSVEEIHLQVVSSFVSLSKLKSLASFRTSYRGGGFSDHSVEFEDNTIILKDKERENSKQFFEALQNVKEKYLLKKGLLFPTPFSRNYLKKIPNPSMDRLFLFFPDNRFMLNGAVPLKELQSETEETSSISEFKIRTLQAIMGKSGLLEGQDKIESEERFNVLNGIVKDFTDCELSPQLKTESDSSLDIRVRPKSNTEIGTYSLDGLSSGQKEIISTLFLIWENTRNAPKVVLIDEPELHLNAEWHRLFIHKLCEIAPWNQYIIATHSEYIMDAVDEDRRILLVSKE